MAVTISTEIKKAVIKQVDTLTIERIDDQDADREDLEQFFIVQDPVVVTDQGGNDFQGFIQVDCINKNRNLYSLTDMVDIVLNLLSRIQIISAAYSILFFSGSSAVVDKQHEACTFNFIAVNCDS